MAANKGRYLSLAVCVTQRELVETLDLALDHTWAARLGWAITHRVLLIN